MARKKTKRRAAGPGYYLFLVGTFLAALALTVNLIIQIVRKPTEVLRYIAGQGGTSEKELWQKHSADFEANATKDMTPEFLAAMAYLESSGDRMAAPPWRLSFNGDWTRIYAPASSAVGLFQFTEETFAYASQFCVRDGKVARAGPWWDAKSCWFTALKTRLSPSDSTEAAAAYLQHQVDQFLARRGIKANRSNRQRLAAVIHLCGPGKADLLVEGFFQPEQVGSCGNQSAAAYVHRIEVLRGRFARLRKLHS